MKLIKTTLAAALVAVIAVSTGAGASGTTDGYHSIQVFPVAVDTTTFTQRFTFSNPGATAIPVQPSYFPGEGTAQSGAGAINCPGFNIPANGQIVFTSLRQMCPALAAGSNFGLLYTYETSPSNLPYAGFSRVSNFAGNGFSVESYASSEFTGSSTRVRGIRRLAAAGGAPAYQTNCFVANMNEVTAGGAANTTNVAVYNSAGTQIGSTTPVVMVPGKLTRLLDVFAAVGAPAGDYNDASVNFSNSTRDGIITFCTVQDNTSFGADFRIGKAWGSQDSADTVNTSWNFPTGPLDDTARRQAIMYRDIVGTPFGSASNTQFRSWAIPANSSTANTHVVYFRQPDWVQCKVINPATGLQPDATYGLEFRMMDVQGNVIAGGNDATGFGEVFLGDKVERNNGASGRYYLQVEANGQNLAAARPYRIQCESGNGHTMLDLIESDVADRF